MLELRPCCEHCGRDLPPDAIDARSCTFECTFCEACATGVLGDVCPNCAGELLARPIRPAALLEAAPPTSERTHKPVDLAAHVDRRRDRPIDRDHPGVALRRYAQAWAAGDLETVVASYAEDFTLHYAGRSDLAGDHVGREAALAAMVEASVRAPRTLDSVDDILVSADGGALVVTETLARDDESATVTRVLRYRVSGGLLRECWLLESDQDLIDHLWRPSST